MNDSQYPPHLRRLLERLDEHEDLETELKRAHGGLPHDIWSTVSAFANSEGGRIILGVYEDGDGGPIMIEGVPNASAMVKAFFDTTRNPQKISYPACGARDVSIEDIEGRRLIVIRIPIAPRKQRPVFVNGNAYSGTFLRLHTGDHRCSKLEVDRMMREAAEQAADALVLNYLSMKDLDPSALATYRRSFQNRDPAHPWNALDDTRFVQALGGYRDDREQGVEGVTVAGLLMFGFEERIRDWRGRHILDYRLHSRDADASTGWDDRLVCEGNLFAAFSALYARLTRELPVPFQLRDAVRIDQSATHVALREALVNLLVHTDYTETEASLVFRRPDGYLFRNPGSSRVARQDLLTGNRSDPRNPALVRMFRMIGLAEEAGTGIPRIVRAWNDLGYQGPRIDVGYERYEFSLELPYVSLLSAEDNNWLSSLGQSWSMDERLALVTAKREGIVDNQMLQRVSQSHPADLTHVLTSLRDRGLFRQLGAKRGARYELAAETISDLPIMPQQSSLFDGSSQGLGASSQGSPRSSQDSGLMSERQGELERIAEPLRVASYVDEATLTRILIELCAVEPLSLRELSELTRRHVEYLRLALRPLLRAGAVEYIYPDQRQHPNQKYRAARRPHS